MKYIFLLSSLFIIKIVHANIPLYPSGIKVSFEYSGKLKKNEFLCLEDKNIDLKKASQTNVTRFIRIINSINDLPKKHYLGLVFFDQKGKKIAHSFVSNSTKLPASHVFYMDRNSDTYFQGLLDQYTIPKKADSFGVAIINHQGKILKDINLLGIPENKITLEQFSSIRSNQKIMLQLETTGKLDNILLKIAAFYLL